MRDRVLAVTAADALPGAKVDGTGTRRRLQALVAIGWSQSKLAVLLGVNRASIQKTIRSDRVAVSTADAVRDVYGRLWNSAPPSADRRARIAVSRARRVARQHGWVPPLAWDDIDTDDAPPTPDDLVVELDEVAVEMAMDGLPVHLTKHERAEVHRRLTARGVSAAEISRRLRCSPRTVVRRRGAA